MEKTFLEILPLAIAATFSPSGLLFITMILSGKEKAQRHALLFLLGAVIFLLILGMVVMETYKSAIGDAAHPGDSSGIIDILFGTMIILIITRSLIKKDKPQAEPKKQKKRPFVVMGFLYMIINVSTLIPFIAACKIISENQLGFADSLPLFLFLIAVTMLMISFPVIVTLTMPLKSEKVMGPVKSFMSKHGPRIAQVYFLAIGVYLIAHGVARV